MANLDPRSSSTLFTRGCFFLPLGYILHDWLEYESVKWEILCIPLADDGGIVVCSGRDIAVVESSGGPGRRSAREGRAGSNRYQSDSHGP